ncbi:hypothetical protein GCM10018782_10650 [Streptomyces griseoaurantiacus]|nr:hypothetical protein GCM10018782_10650 [Streptomyces griseoaurantiacus]
MRRPADGAGLAWAAGLLVVIGAHAHGAVVGPAAALRRRAMRSRWRSQSRHASRRCAESCGSRASSTLIRAPITVESAMVHPGAPAHDVAVRARAPPPIGGAIRVVRWRVAGRRVVVRGPWEIEGAHARCAGGKEGAAVPALVSRATDPTTPESYGSQS